MSEREINELKALLAEQSRAMSDQREILARIDERQQAAQLRDAQRDGRVQAIAQFCDKAQLDIDRNKQALARYKWFAVTAGAAVISLVAKALWSLIAK